MTCRHQGWIAAGLLMAGAACTALPSSDSPVTVVPALVAPAAGTAAATPAPAGPVAAGSPSAVNDLDDQDKQDLAALFASDDTQQYWGNDIVSDGSGAYFTAMALPKVGTSLGVAADAGKLPDVRRFRKRDLQETSRTLNIVKEGNRQQAVIEATVYQQGFIDLEFPLQTRTMELKLRQRQNFHAVKVNKRWQLAKVSRVEVEPDSDKATLAITQLTAKVDGQPLLTLNGGINPVALDQIPKLRPGQALDLTVNAERSDKSPTVGVLAIMRLPRLGGAVRLQADTTAGTFSRSFTVPDRPGLYRAGAELLDLKGLLDEPKRVDLSMWGFTFRVQGQ